MKRMVGNILEMVGNHETDGWKYFEKGGYQESSETAGGGRKSLEAVQNPWRRPIYSGGGPKSLEAALNPWRRPKIPGGGPKPWRRLDIFRNGWQS